MSREVVKFNGRPEELAFKYVTPRAGENEHGQYFMYTTKDDRVLFATPALNRKIQEMALAAGERLQIQLLANKQWEVKRVDPPAGGPGFSAPASSLASALNMSNGHNGTTHPAPTAAPAAPCLMTGESQQMLSQFIGVYEVLVALEKYSELKGRPVRFDPQDFRAAAISAYIGQQRGGR